MASRVEVQSRELRSIRFYITKDSILRSQFQFLTVKVHHQLRAYIDHFLVSEARLHKK